MAAIPAWFDEASYLTSKLAQLKSIGNNDYANINQLKVAIEAAGYTTYSHFEQYSLVERTNPNDYFNTNEYLAAKAAALNTAAYQGKTNWTVDSVALALQNAGFTSAYDHFAKVGWTENVNPSNAFDISSYLATKAASLNAAAYNGKTDWTAADVQAAFVAAGVDPVAHYLSNGKTETGVAVTAVPAAEQVAAGVAGTFTLTTGADTIVGTGGNDTILAGETVAGVDGEGVIVYQAQLQSTDVISGGAGTDTLKVTTESAIAKVAPTLTGVEVVELASGKGITFDTASYADVASLKVTKATAAVELTAASTADISIAGVSGSGDIKAFGGKSVTVTDTVNTGNIVVGDTGNKNYAAGDVVVTDGKQAGAITVDGGANVTVTATSKVATGNITIGATKAASGAVVVTQNLTTTGDQLDNSVKSISVTGGTSVNVTVNGTITADAAGDNNNTLTSSSVSVLGNGKTTDVTVSQNLTATDYSKAGSAAVNATQTLTFKALAKGETTTVNGLTFTASKALTADQVAAAFANLTATDTQTATGPTANGYYTNALGTVAGWTSGAATGSSVTFTAAAATVAFDYTAGAIDPTSVYSAGTAAGSAETADVSVAYNTVAVDDNAVAAIKNITLNGFTKATLGASGSLDALENLSLTNSAGATGVSAVLDTVRTALNLSVNNITGSVDLDNGSATITNLNLTATGTKSSFDLTAAAVTDATIDAQVALKLTNASMTAVKNVTIKGAGAVDLGDISGYGKLDTFNASANTGGITATVSTDSSSAKTLTGKITEYVFSAGNDNVTLNDTVINTKITLGAGDDTLTLATGTTQSKAVLDGGTGTNTIAMAAADAETLSKTNAFEAQMTGFSHLTVGEVATKTTNTVDLANLDDISYVTTKGSADAAESVDITIAVTTQLNAADTDDVSITIGGDVYTASNLARGADAAADAATIASALADAIDGQNGLSATAVGAKLTVTGPDGAYLPVSAVSDLTVTGTAVATVDAKEITSSLLVLNNMADNGTVVLTAAGMGAVVNLTDASGDANVLNVITGDLVGKASINVGTVYAAGVETINLTTTDTFTDTTGAKDLFGHDIADGKDDSNSAGTLRLAGDKLATVTVGGAGDIVLTTESTVLKTVNAASLTGDLTYTADVASLAVTSGSGADSLTADASDVTLHGGAGNDTLTVKAGADRVNLYGDGGKDTFVIEGASTTVSSYAIIRGVESGDVIQLSGANTFKQAQVTLSEGATVTTQALADQAMKGLAVGEMGWFQTGGNTFIVLDSGADSTTGFNNAEDVIVMLTGTVDLSTASYNVTHNTLEIA